MTVAVRDLLELIGIALAVAAVVVATHLVWTGLVVGAVAFIYLSHFWAWEAEIRIGRQKDETPPKQ